MRCKPAAEVKAHMSRLLTELHVPYAAREDDRRNSGLQVQVPGAFGNRLRLVFVTLSKRFTVVQRVRANRRAHDFIIIICTLQIARARDLQLVLDYKALTSRAHTIIN